MMQTNSQRVILAVDHAWPILDISGKVCIYWLLMHAK